MPQVLIAATTWIRSIPLPQFVCVCVCVWHGFPRDVSNFLPHPKDALVGLLATVIALNIGRE